MWVLGPQLRFSDRVLLTLESSLSGSLLATSVLRCPVLICYLERALDQRRKHVYLEKELKKKTLLLNMMCLSDRVREASSDPSS